jgi:peptidyl-dipeptidase Dcp
MAQSPGKVMELLERVWGPAVASAERERGFLEEFLSAELGVPGSQVESWDWRYCAEKVRLEKYKFDESQLKPYLSLPGKLACCLLAAVDAATHSFLAAVYFA